MPPGPGRHRPPCGRVLPGRLPFLAGVLWLWLGSIMILAGGILNAEMDVERAAAKGESHPGENLDQTDHHNDADADGAASSPASAGSLEGAPRNGEHVGVGPVDLLAARHLS